MPIVDDRDRIEPAYLEGIRLFNGGCFFEAHEAWESAWLRAEGRERMFYQGLIQAAAAFVKLQHNRRWGAQVLYRKSLEKLQHFRGVYKGLQIGRFNAQMAELFATVLDADPEAPIDGPAYVARAPRIEWSGALPDQPEPAPAQPSFLKDETRGQGPDAGSR